MGVRSTAVVSTVQLSISLIDNILYSYKKLQDTKNILGIEYSNTMISFEE